MKTIRSTGVRSALALAIAAALLLPCAAQADSLIQRARELVEQRQAKEAYRLLAPEEGARAGNPEFDLLLGLAAIDAGEAERAVFALERVLESQPGNARARAEIARAYLALGERDSAKREFEAVRRQAIPDEVKATVDQFLSAIATADVTRITGFVEAGMGHDSNVNSATSAGQIALPALGGLIATLGPGATGRSDTYTSLAGGLGVTHRLTNEWAVTGNASAAAKVNGTATQFDTLSVEGSAGVRWSDKEDAVTVALQAQSFQLDWNRLRDTHGIVGQWQRSFDTRRQATVFVQRAELRYPGQDIRNADRQVVGAGYASALEMRYTPVLYVGAYGGTEKELAANVPHLGHELLGLRLGLQARLGGGWSAFANASHEERRYGGPDPIFLAVRKDQQTDLSAGLSYLLRPNTTITGQLSHTENRSGIALNQFRRTVGGLTVRVSF